MEKGTKIRIASWIILILLFLSTVLIIIKSEKITEKVDCYDNNNRKIIDIQCEQTYLAENLIIYIILAFSSVIIFAINGIDGISYAMTGIGLYETIFGKEQDK